MGGPELPQPVTVGTKDTIEVNWSCSFVTVMSAGQLMVVGCVSRTATGKLQLVVWPAASAAVHWTKVTPTGKNEPGGGVQTTLVTTEHVAVAGGSGKLTTAPHPLVSLLGTAMARHLSVIGAVSSTITEAPHESEAPRLLTTVRVTGFVPSG